MSEDKIIDLFKKSSQNKNNDKQRFFKGFQYVKLSRDENGNYFNEKSLREYAEKCCYIVTVMRRIGPGVSLYKYNVPYSSLLKFLDRFKNSKTYGEIIDIERYVPNDLA